MADSVDGRRVKFGPKDFKQVTKTEAGRLKHLRMGGRFSVPETITKIMREIPGKGGKKAPDFIASAKRVFKHFAPIIGKSIKAATRKSGMPDMEDADRMIRETGARYFAEKRSRESDGRRKRNTQKRDY